LLCGPGAEERTSGFQRCAIAPAASGKPGANRAVIVYGAGAGVEGRWSYPRYAVQLA